jgi:lysophospholipase L1-like esterase
MVLKELLNQGGARDDPAYWVVEEGLCGRTTCRDDPVEGDRNGLAQLMPILETHKPIDIVVLMLGTNDLKVRYSPMPYDIARGAQRIVTAIQNSKTGPGDTSPKVLWICPPPTVKSPGFEHLFADSVELSKKLPPWFKQLAQESGVPLLEAGTVVQTSAVDGIHFDPDEHRKLAEAVAKIVCDMAPTFSLNKG